jgi:DNA repair protein RadD
VSLLREPQVQFKSNIYQAWNEGAQNVMGVAPTGFGKTVVMGSIAQDFDAPTGAIAHRQELVSQIAMAFNREEVPHAVIAPKGVIKEIIQAEMELHGRSFYKPSAVVRVAGVDSLRSYDDRRWFEQVRLLLVDEGHHVQKTNKWGREMQKFPNALGLLFTAHALRADGGGLGRHSDGVVDKLVVAPCARQIINQGYLTDYTVHCPPGDVDTSDIPIGENGELNMAMTRDRIESSRTIVGDVVSHYKRIAEGELGITFAVSLKAAHQIKDKFISSGIPAAVIEAKTPIAERAHIMRLYRERKYLQLVNFDTLGEGTDVPACTVVSMARPSASFQLVAQQFGRMLRILVSDDLNARWHGFTDAQRLAYIAASSKPRGILIDHVGNIAIAGGVGRHGLPDRPRVYTLDRREKRAKNADDAIPLTVCLNEGYTAPLWRDGPITAEKCYKPYERVLSACPHCGMPKPPPVGRSSPEEVDGDLVELDPEVLRQLRGEIDRIDLAPRYPPNASHEVMGSIKKRHWERQQAQHSLRDAITTWAGWHTNHLGRPEREALKRFFFQFGIDMATAQTLGVREAAELETLVRAQLTQHNIVKVI